MSQHYHFIGIGGIGMGAIASLLLAKGVRVSGSDLKENQMTAQLKEKGAKIFVGHDSSQIEGADFVVFSSAVDRHNPELEAATQKKIPILQRAQVLADLMKGYFGITVAGAHGKTTTTSMISHLLAKAGLEPTSAVGGIVHSNATNAWLGTGKYFVSEVDESDGSFLYFNPMFSVITNMDREHLDYYGDWNNIVKAYKHFIDKTNPQGLLFICAEDERLLQILESSGKLYKTYGLSSKFDVYAENVQFDGFSSQFDCYSNKKRIGSIKLNVPGEHNILNALAAVSVGLSLMIDFEIIQQSLEEFRSVKRRFQLMGQVNNILVVDDYAHHPTEIKATLQAAKAVKKKRLVVVFQPHRYSRLKFLMDEFAKSLIDSDYTIITDIYAASELPIEGVSSEKLTELLQSMTDKPVIYLKKDKINDYLLNLLRREDLVLLLGAGDITKISEELVVRLKQYQEQHARLTPSQNKLSLKVIL